VFDGGLMDLFPAKVGTPGPSAPTAIVQVRTAEEGDTGPDCACLDPGPEAQDGSDPGTTKLTSPEEDVAAAEIELTSNDLRELDRAASSITIRGERYPEEMEKRTGL
jgi:hypothetical protein